uniref:RNA binding motif protein 34 n=1 Tax=Takifugu rubripes TaxID=31033 RepID=H2TU41_TAKRU
MDCNLGIHVRSEKMLPGQQPADYELGQVSGCLFQKDSAASATPLSALFGSAAPATMLVFHPPAEVSASTSPEVKKKKPAEVSGQPGLTCKRKNKIQSKAEKRLEGREMGLHIADEDERQKKTSVKKTRKHDAEEKGVEHWVEKRQRKRARKEEEAQKRKRTVFVGNLPSSCSKKTLQNLFRDEGSIESIRFRSVVREDPSMSRKVAVIKRKIHPKKQSMNAYVVFKDEGGVTRALERNGLEIEKDFYIRVDKVHDHKRSVFVGNLSFDINELAFRHHFEDCGSVEAVRLVRDQNSGLGKGFGYILFKSADAVQLALKLDGSKLQGRRIRVRRSLKESENKGAKGRFGKGPAPERERHQGRIGSPKKFSRQQRTSKIYTSFSGIKVDPNVKTKKNQAKKVKPKKSVHI